MKNRGPILVFDCGDGRTEVEGSALEVGGHGSLPFFSGNREDVHGDCTVV